MPNPPRPKEFCRWRSAHQTPTLGYWATASGQTFISQWVASIIYFPLNPPREVPRPPGQGTRLGSGSKVWYPNQRPICYYSIYISTYSREKFFSRLNIYKGLVSLEELVGGVLLKVLLNCTFLESVPYPILLRYLCFLVLFTAECAVSLNGNHCLWSTYHVSVLTWMLYRNAQGRYIVPVLQRYRELSLREVKQFAHN